MWPSRQARLRTGNERIKNIADGPSGRLHRRPPAVLPPPPFPFAPRHNPIGNPSTGRHPPLGGGRMLARPPCPEYGPHRLDSIVTIHKNPRRTKKLRLIRFSPLPRRKEVVIRKPFPESRWARRFFRWACRCRAAAAGDGPPPGGAMGLSGAPPSFAWRGGSVGADLRAARHKPSFRTARPEVGSCRRERPTRNRKVFSGQLPRHYPWSGRQSGPGNRALPCRMPMPRAQLEPALPCRRLDSAAESIQSRQASGSKSAAPCLQRGQMKSSGRVSPSWT